jgi:hypothetical protein
LAIVADQVPGDRPIIRLTFGHANILSLEVQQSYHDPNDRCQ